MNPWDHLVEADKPLRDAEKAFQAAETPLHRAAFVRALRRAGDARADTVEAMGVLLAAVAGMRWNKPSDAELGRVVAHYALDAIRRMLSSRIPNRVNVLMLTHGDILYHREDTNADGSPARWRISGKLKTWKTRPEEFRIPIKRGMRSSGYLDQHNAHWLTMDE